MKPISLILALACAAVVSVTGIANAKSHHHHYRAVHHYSGPTRGGYFDYDSWASRHATSPADRSGAGNFKNLSPPAGGIGRVDSET